MKTLTQIAALNRIVNEFSRRGWHEHHDVVPDIIRRIADGGGFPNVDKLSASVPALFLAANKADRREVRGALDRALGDACIVRDTVPALGSVHVHRNVTQTFIWGNREVNKKKIEIHNQGQFAGNVDSPDAEVNLDQQQQAIVADPHQLLRGGLEHPEVQAILALPAAPEEKSSLLGSKLAKITGVGLDVATDFAAKVVGELIRPK